MLLLLFMGGTAAGGGGECCCCCCCGTLFRGGGRGRAAGTGQVIRVMGLTSPPAGSVGFVNPRASPKHSAAPTGTPSR
ncbi:hypothetical protein E2C01_037321 [Portunus trituberculatus]|uniref:Secreted protein n=1 Tax=Portunus trituberculatus TaxID=210409 RepID=A0A5B7FEN2_PORTR|nr:hypothetical protein [Portunus trituberculatus]